MRTLTNLWIAFQSTFFGKIFISSVLPFSEILQSFWFENQICACEIMARTPVKLVTLSWFLLLNLLPTSRFPNILTQDIHHNQLTPDIFQKLKFPICGNIPCFAKPSILAFLKHNHTYKWMSFKQYNKSDVTRLFFGHLCMDLFI